MTGRGLLVLIFIGGAAAGAGGAWLLLRGTGAPGAARGPAAPDPGVPAAPPSALGAPRAATTTAIRLNDAAARVRLPVVARGHFEYLNRRVEEACAAEEGTLPPPTPPASAGVRACEVLSTSLMGFGAGLAVGDVDNDGDDDLYVPAPGPPGTDRRNRLFRNDREAGFTDVTAASGAAGDDWSLGAVFGDVDGDGWLDLYVTNFGPNRLYRNRGDGTFEEVPQAGGAEEPGNSASATFGDVDGDGDLDLFVANASSFEIEENIADPQYPFGMAGLRNALYENLGGLRFVKKRDPWAIERSAFISLGAVFFDFDRDGDQDLFVTNDGDVDDLFSNLERGVFYNTASVFGIYDQMAGMGIAIGDVSGDGFPEIFISHWDNEPDTLFLNPGGGFDHNDYVRTGRFLNATCSANAFTRPLGSVGWGAWFVDLDLDGDLDLFQARNNIGALSVPAMSRPNGVYENLGDGRFQDVSAASGVDPDGVGQISFGVATSDVDLDGDPDVLVSNLEAPVQVLRNDSQKGNGVTLRLRMRRGNRFAIGAYVTVIAGDRTQARQVLAGGSYLSTSSTDLIFGLGAATQADTVLVRWPDRTAEDRFGPLAAGQVHVLEPYADDPL